MKNVEMNKSGEWDDNKLKGHIGENVVEFLFSSIGWKCVKYGIENNIAELKETLRNNSSELSLKIRSMPDFIFP